MFQTLLHSILGLNYKAIAVAYTGIAASLLVGGQTIHSQFRVPIVIEEHTTSYLNINSSAAHELRFSKICIIDEAILMSFKLLELLDRFFRDVTRNTNIPFGGMLMLLAGDFMQCLAIKDEDDCDMNESGENIIIKRSYLWQYFVQYTLKKNKKFSWFLPYLSKNPYNSFIKQATIKLTTYLKSS